MVAFLVEEGGADIWAKERETNLVMEADDGEVLGPAPVAEFDTNFPLHVAASECNRRVIDYFLTECGMPVDTCTLESRHTPLLLAALSDQDEMKALSFAK